MQVWNSVKRELDWCYWIALPVSTVVQSSNTVSCVSLSFRTHPGILAFVTYILCPNGIEMPLPVEWKNYLPEWIDQSEIQVEIKFIDNTIMWSPSLFFISFWSLKWSHGVSLTYSGSVTNKCINDMCPHQFKMVEIQIKYRLSRWRRCI